MSITIAVLNLVASLAILPLSYLEDERELRPSSTLTLYLVASVLIDVFASWVSTSHDFAETSAILIPGVALKVALLIVENRSKRKYFVQKYRDVCPEEFSGLINRSLFWWLKDLLLKATQRRLTPDDTYELDESLKRGDLSHRIKKSWSKRSKPEGRLSYAMSVFRCFKMELLSIIIPRLCLIAFTFAQPLLISRVIGILYEPDTRESRQYGYQLIAATVLVYLGIAFTTLHSNHLLFRFIAMFRGATVSLIYDHSMQLPQADIENAAAISLMSNDVDHISECLEELNEVWARSIELFVGVPLLVQQLGWVAFVPFLVVIISSYGSSIVTRLIGTRRAEWAAATESRISKTKSVLGEIKGIKMMGLDDKVISLLQDERIYETKKQERFCWIMVWVNVVANIPSAMAPAATFAVYMLQSWIRGSGSLDTVRAFTSLALIHLVAYPAARLLSAAPRVAASLGSLDRIQSFLLKPKMPSLRNEDFGPYRDNEDDHINDTPLPNGHGISGSEQTASRSSRFAIAAKHVDVSLPSGQNLLKGLNLSIKEGSLLCVTGPVGSGKSTLLKALLGEIECTQGFIDRSPSVNSIAYCAQNPWIPRGTVKEIVCGCFSGTKEPVDEEWYLTVLEACSLSQDILSFPLADATVVGSRGGKLSGGQKQRIALARALYQRSRLFLLDNTFSSLDAETQKEVSGSLFGRNGLFKRINATVVIVTYDVELLRQADNIAYLSTRLQGKVVQGKYTALTTIGVLKPRELQSTLLQEHDHHSDMGSGKLDAMTDFEGPSIEEVKDLDRKMGDVAVYSYYLRVIGPRRLAVFVFFASLTAFSNTFSSIWLKWWSDIHGQQAATYALIYFLLSIGVALGIGGYAWAIAVVIAPSTGRNLHKSLLDIVFKAPMSFFTNTETGTILNRFSQDMSMIQGPLSTGLLQTVTNFLAAVGEAALIATGSYYMAATIPILFLLMYLLQHFYLQTSRQLRLLELESRSPLYAHFLETLEGMETVRAFGWQSKEKQEHERRLDYSQKPYYLMFCIERWLSLALDLIVASLAGIVVALAMNFRYSTSPGLLGVSLNAVLAFNQSLAQLTTGWTNLETCLGAIARLRQLQIDVKPEQDPHGDCLYPPSSWPFQGQVSIENLNASYGMETQSLALRNINLDIHQKDHVALCGRTGSGKSTLFGALLRMLPSMNGEIKIDSIDTSRVELCTLRRRIVSITQDFVHLPGTIRLNLDPFQQCTDPDVQAILTKIHLHGKVVSLGGLESEFHISSFSTGELQLLSIARAVLQHNAQKTKLILVDEATSSLDENTANLVQNLIATEFSDSTVITIAHQADAIKRADKAVLLKNGTIERVGSPEVILT
ncbi:putative multidrug resistance protein [Microthyrium microscopicum]|uniref:Putative multidrug resistance protein n=1 Tax=Microthyrium microscopicum TaxID=703497 RepID=A0A6A6UEW0_9PEZI|nr:putative multidrug resistance protein [Microthyrium microscopicum]